MFCAKKIIILFAIIITVPISVHAYKILCLFPYPGKSHHMVFEPLLEGLRNRGHDLTVVSFFPSPKPLQNRRDVSLVDLAPLQVEMIDLKHVNSFFGLKYLEHVPLVTGLAKKNLELCKILLNAKVFKEFINAEGTYDVVLVEHFNSDCMLGLIHNYRLPSVGVMSSAMLPWTPLRVGAPDNPSYVPGMTLPLTDQMTFFERIVNTAFLFFYITWYDTVIRREEQRILERKLGKRLPALEDIAKNTSIVLVNTHHSWNGVRNLPPSVVEIGGIHLNNKTSHPLPAHLNEWVSETKHGFILFSFGSLIRGSTLPPKQLDAILNVLARFPQRFVLKWEETINRLPDNLLVMKWVPQFELLNHSNCVAFITHGGLLSLTEAVSAGVPVLTVPILGDQFGNAAHAQQAGFGATLRLQDLDEGTFEAALKDVLSAKMKLRAKQVRALWRDRPLSPMDTAIFHIERTARHKGLQLSCEARNMHRLQLAMLDVLALGVLLSVFIAFGLSRICGRYGKLKKS